MELGKVCIIVYYVHRSKRVCSGQVF